MDVWEKHRELFHYTTQGGLTGILDSRALHATHYRHLNDASETRHLTRKLKEIATPSVMEMAGAIIKNNARAATYVKEQGGLNPFVDQQLELMIDALYRVTFGEGRKHKFLEPYFVCFSAHSEGAYEWQHGLLSLWRAYGRDIGYAIVFDTIRLNDLMQREATRHYYAPGFLGDVVYDGDEAAFQEDCGELVALVSKQFPILLTGKKPDLNSLFTPFAIATSRYKHEAFREEHEVRMMFSPLSKGLVNPNHPTYNTKSEKKVNFRNGLTPYIALFGQADDVLPITRIIVGPHPEKDARREKLLRYLDYNRINLEVTTSRTPLLF